MRLAALLVLAATPTRAAGADADLLKVAVMDLRLSANIPPELGESLGGLVTGTLDDMRAFKSISTQDIKQMIGFERQKDLLGCDSQTSCLAEIGGALGADLLVTGSITLVEGTYLVQMQLIRIAAARVESRVSREYRGGPLGLTKEIQIATQLLMRDTLAQRSGRLMVNTAEEGATVKVDGATVGVTPLAAPLELAQGMHTVVIEKEGFIRFSRDVLVTKDQGIALDAPLRPSPEFVAAYQAGVGRWRLATWSLIGAGAAALAGGAASYVVGAQKAEALARDVRAYNGQSVRPAAERADLDSREREIAAWDTVTVIAGGVGAVALAAGLVMSFNGPDPDRYVTEPAPGPSEQGGVAPLGLSLSWSPGELTLRALFAFE